MNRVCFQLKKKKRETKSIHYIKHSQPEIQVNFFTRALDKWSINVKWDIVL